MGACPTCGSYGSGTVVRVRRGGRAYMRPGDRRRFWSVRERALVGGDGPAHWMRVYYHGTGRYRSCPDEWHKRRYSHRSGPDGWGPKPYTGLNLHGAPGEQDERRKAKARRQREAQSKQRR